MESGTADLLGNAVLLNGTRQREKDTTGYPQRKLDGQCSV